MVRPVDVGRRLGFTISQLGLFWRGFLWAFRSMRTEEAKERKFFTLKKDTLSFREYGMKLPNCVGMLQRWLKIWEAKWVCLSLVCVALQEKRSGLQSSLETWKFWGLWSTTSRGEKSERPRWVLKKENQEREWVLAVETLSELVTVSET